MKTQTALKELYEQKLARYEEEQMFDDVLQKLNTEDPELLMLEIEEHRDDADWLFRLGKAYANIGNSLAAIEAFRDALKINPKCDVYNHFIGLEYIKLGQTALALESFNNVANYEDSLSTIGSIYLSAGELDNALYYLKIVDDSPNCSKNNEYLQAKTFAAKGNYYDALRYIDKALDVI